MIKDWFKLPTIDRDNTVIVEGPDMDLVMRTGLLLTGADGEWGVKHSMEVTSKGFRIVLGEKTARDHEFDEIRRAMEKDIDEMLEKASVANTEGTGERTDV